MSAGRGYGVYEPNTEFLSNIDDYLHNRFLNIGIFIIEITVINKTSYFLAKVCTQITCGYSKSSCLCWKKQ